MRNRSTDNMEVQSILRPSVAQLLQNGTLSEAQQEEYVQIIKAIKWPLNFIAMLMTLMSTIVFARTKNRSSSTAFIMAINIFGFFSAILSLVGYTINFTLDSNSKSCLTYTQYMNMYTGAVCRRLVYLMNMMMSGQRLTVIAMPFLARKKFRNSLNLVIISIVVVITFVFHVYIPISYTIIKRADGKYRIDQSQLYDNNNQEFETLATVTKFIFAFLPLMASLLANIVLLTYLKHHAKTTKKLCSYQNTDQAYIRRNRQITTIVLISSVSFTLFSLPANIHLLTTTYTTDYGFNMREHYLYIVINEALLGLLSLGDIANFLCYIFLSSAFRGQFHAAFKHCSLRGSQLTVTVGRNKAPSPSSSIATLTTIN